MAESQFRQPQPGDTIMTPEPGMEECDFCCALHPIWGYPAKDFDMIDQINYGSIGWWAACETCHVLVEDDRWSELTARSLATFEAKHGPVKDREGLRDLMTRLHFRFKNARIGPAVLIPEGT